MVRSERANRGHPTGAESPGIRYEVAGTGLAATCPDIGSSRLEGVVEGDYALLLPAGTYDLYLRDQGEPDKSLVLEDVVLSAGESLEGVDLSLP